MGQRWVYLNGRIVPEDEAHLSVFDAGFLHGASAFTTMRAHQGKVFRLGQHLDRLGETVRLLGLRVHADREALEAAVRDVLQANALTEARMRITLSSGDIHDELATALVTAEPVPEHPWEWFEKGLTLVVTAFKQGQGDPTFGYKTGCYLPRVLARQEAAAKGADEALWYTPDSRLAEACFCNVFLVLGGKVCTPPRDTPVLPGVVRAAVLELCDKMGLPADDQTPLTVREMLAAEEMFLTSSVSGVRPVTRVEQHAVGDERPGLVTRRLMQAYQDLLEAECGPAEGAAR